MRKIKSYTITAAILLFIGISSVMNLQASPAVIKSGNIELNKAEKILIAPDAVAYEWYLNGEKLAENGNSISVSTSGKYTVKFTSLNGQISEKSISLKVNANGEIITIYTIGDSTVQDYAAGYYPRTGWGQVLQYFFDENYVVVDNRAVGGTSAKSYYNYYWKENAIDPDVNWALNVNELDSGDYVFIQFGINDASSDTARHTEPFGTFQEYLTKYVEQSQAKGAIPVLVATLRRNSWNEDGTVYPAYHDYPIAARELAAELNVPLIDLDKRSGELMNQLGQDYTTSYWYNTYEPGEYANYPSGNTDPVHFQRSGAEEMARLVVQGLQNDTTFAAIDSVAQYASDLYQIEVTANDSLAGMITRTASYPQGIEIHIKAKPNDGYVFVEWQNESGEAVSTDPIFIFTMGDSDISYKAIFEYVGFGDSELWIEAECGEVGSQWYTLEDTLASNGKYVTIESGYTAGNSSPASSSSGRITYTFNAAEGIYHVYVRVLFPTVTDDSFWMKLDDGTWSKVTWDEAYTEWTWKEAMSVELTEGEHTMTIAGREDGALIDKFHLGSSLPTGIGSDDNCCCDTATAVIELNEQNEIFTQKIWSNEAQTLFIYYEIKTAGKVDFAIYNTLGQIIYNESLGNLNAGTFTHSLNPGLNPGIYILKSGLEGNIRSTKFLIH